MSRTSIAGHFVFFIVRLILAITVAETACHSKYYHSPLCVNHPIGYSCECGPGFRWNTKTCVALGLDSRLEFSHAEPAKYALLKDKAFPELRAFTIALWVRVADPERPGTILSYSHEASRNLLQITSGPTLRLRIHGEEITTNFKANSSAWIHLAWTWTEDGSWKFFIDGLVRKGTSRADKIIPGGGKLVLGQAGETPEKGYVTKHAFVGDISGVNIWNKDLNFRQIKNIISDCNLIQCGNAIEWADFRMGIGGTLKLRWPSLIREMSECITDETAAKTCDNFCSFTIGPQCNEGILGNVKWERTPAGNNATAPCPHSKANQTALAYRECVRDDQDNTGRWAEPVMDPCISPSELSFKKTAKKIKREGASPNHGKRMLKLLEAMTNQTTAVYYNSILDIAVVTETMDIIVREQVTIVDHHLQKASTFVYGLDRGHDQQLYPTYEDTNKFGQRICALVDSLLSDRNSVGWGGMLPRGTQGAFLLTTWHTFIKQFISTQKLYVMRADISSDTDMMLNISLPRLSLVSQRLALQPHIEIHLPSKPVSEVAEEDKIESKMVDIFIDGLDNSTTQYESQDLDVSLAWMRNPNIVPNHNVSVKSKDDNINTALLYVYLEGASTSLSYSVSATFAIINTFNISNPECVSLQHQNGQMTRNWTRQRCKALNSTSAFVTCQCHSPGIMAAITDMYDVNWDNGERPLDLMGVPSYIGCSLSAALCFLSMILLIYFRTQSKTAELHKHFAMAIFCCQLTFLLGIDKIHSQMMCRIFAVTFHYFFLAIFQWLMNEAFNLYIVITYAAHSHGEHTEGGSQWRYYILGWVLPAVLVGAFVGTHMDDYYAQDMCWISWKYVWLFFGPAICIISVIVLVLIFTAKEHHESSYSKNERTNKMIVIYAKALWTQTILLIVCWFFAFLSIKMGGIIIKCLFALFNGLQGAFFFVFYFLLNEEVQAVYKASLKKKNLSRHGYEFSSNSSMEDIPLSAVNQNAVLEEEIVCAGAANNCSPLPCRSHDGQQVRSRRKRTEIEQSSSSDEEGSDCEMMITSV